MAKTLGTHLAYANADLIRDATLSATNEDPDYPIARVQTDDVDSPGRPFKATTDETTITIVLAEEDTPEGLAIINHNLAGATVTLSNTAGFSEVIEIPARTASGLCVNAWFDMRELPNRADTDWELEIAGASTLIAIGRIVLVGSSGLKPVQFLVSTPRVRPDRLESSLATFYGHEMVYDKGVRRRAMSGRTVTDEQRGYAFTAWEAAAGRVLPFLFLPDTDSNDAWWVRFSDFQWTEDTPEVKPAEIAVTEVSMGLHLYEAVGSPGSP